MRTTRRGALKGLLEPLLESLVDDLVAQVEPSVVAGLAEFVAFLVQGYGVELVRLTALGTFS